ncbi:MAG: hypothetical protein JWO72_907 [Caulobacteraceae bacterium]|nr:hypothetical protein [Caulobacteraceae bacterium]
MTQTITRLFDNYADAEAAVAELERMGVPHRDISIVANNTDHAHDHRIAARKPDDAAGEAAEDAGKGAGIGGLVGAGGGLLAGLGLLAIPGLGPVVAAGWLASTAVGALAGAAVGGAGGGLIGALTHAGVSKEDAHVYSEGVRRGATLLSVKVDDNKEVEVRRTLDGFNGVEAAGRGVAYREDGWSQYDESAPAYSSEEAERERTRYTGDRGEPRV